MTRTPTALIADDEEHLRTHLRGKLERLWPELRIVGEAANGVEAAQAIAQLAPAVAFLDIKMPGLSGLEVAQGIETDTRVVFVTAFDQYALDAFEREAVDYLVKPVTDERLARSVERLRKAFQEAAPLPELAQLLSQLTRGPARPEAGAPPLRWVRASRGNTTSHVPIQDVLYFQADDKYVVVHTRDGEHLIRTPLAELMEGLDPDTFWQVHRSTIVNMEYVAGTRRDDAGRLFVRLQNRETQGETKSETELPVSRAYAHRFRQM
ncbi:MULTISPECIES: LytR/AlgR family response regulator transcription factor [Cupriavidus]|uniref:LytTR family DNA-binding domain-containing protein n=2 Tax=Burkholderiaceae TaxID=119060 RepID=A0AAE9I7B8_9BURK|nr:MULTISPECIES: LytTR family DNA-binding domain-containing protein [Cupriavidus]TSP11786.1 response regulator transcription factor [Cupriavidus campinensis]URF07591.1 LytTR family DNA-binding domain-containing protein [Cupriavidus campinensis]